MGKAEDSMERRRQLAEARIREEARLEEAFPTGGGSHGRFNIQLHPKDRRGKFRETFTVPTRGTPAHFEQHLAMPEEQRKSAMKFMSDDEVLGLQKHIFDTRGPGPLVAEVGREWGPRYRASRWQTSHAGGGGITDTKGEYVHGWSGKLSNGKYTATLSKADGSTAHGDGDSPQKAAEDAHSKHVGGQATPPSASLSSSDRLAAHNELHRRMAGQAEPHAPSQPKPLSPEQVRRMDEQDRERDQRRLMRPQPVTSPGGQEIGRVARSNPVSEQWGAIHHEHGPLGAYKNRIEAEDAVLAATEPRRPSSVHDVEWNALKAHKAGNLHGYLSSLSPEEERNLSSTLAGRTTPGSHDAEAKLAMNDAAITHLWGQGHKPFPSEFPMVKARHEARLAGKNPHYEALRQTFDPKRPGGGMQMAKTFMPAAAKVGVARMVAGDDPAGREDFHREVRSWLLNDKTAPKSVAGILHAGDRDPTPSPGYEVIRGNVHRRRMREAAAQRGPGQLREAAELARELRESQS